MVLIWHKIGQKSRGLVPPCELVSSVILCHCDQLRILNATGQRLALPAVEGLALATFVHDILNQVARAGRHHLGASVGTTEGSGEDFDCLCFVHGSNMAQNRAKIKGSCASTATGFLPLDFSTLTCKDNRLPNHNGRNILRGSYHLAV